MRLHLDTSFLIDWDRNDPRIHRLRDEIVTGLHDVSIDPIVETEFLAGSRPRPSREIVLDALLALGARLELGSDVTSLAASWLAPMDEPKRRAHFADALIAAAAEIAGARLVTGDARISKVLPVSPYLY